MDSLPVYVKSPDPVIPSARRDMRKSILECDSRSTICFPDDNDVELGPYRTSYLRKNSCDVPSSPSSSASTCAPRTPVTPTTAPPTYKASTRLDPPAQSSNKEAIPLHSRSPFPPAVPFVSFPEGAVESSPTISRPSSYLAPCITSRLGGNGEDHEPEEDDIYISEAYLDSRPASPVYRVPTPMPLMSSELPTPPPPVLAFQPPSVYPVSHTTASRDASGHDGLVVTVHTQSSTETL
ncbi:MAG: hypothetical protein NXY57DRAFT_178439 [Lentinula lateritia]|nr:MAG: hypothetical protein NXY57DRAFT_178439 [Lentinula lateritia]